MKRRKFLTHALHGGALAVAGILAVPAAITAIAPGFIGRRKKVWRPVGPVDGFPPGETLRAIVELERNDWSRSLRRQLIYVRREAEDAWVVFSRNCTDLSCPITWDAGSRTFLCPCHGGIFDRHGTPMAGPPSRPLYRFHHRVRDGLLEVDVHSVPPMS
jgi:menaquinol-cytochrome c reductase iron-sulfur subunit